MRELSYDIKEEYRSQIKTILQSSGFFFDFEIEIVMSILDETLRDGQEKSEYYWNFLHEGDRILGFGIFGPNPSTIDSWDAYWLAVSQDYRHQGIGEILLTDLERIAALKQGKLLWIETSGKAQYDPTRHFYDKMHYEKIATLPDYYGKGDDKIIYRKIL